MDSAQIKERIKTLPSEPGVYRFKDAEGTIIYVGKAKNLKKRVSQYFVDPERLTRKTRILVSKIADLEHTVVGSEEDALLLENNLIKQYQPRYNILLKDSKTYPWICIKREPFPRVFLTRRFVKDGSLYFGPYSSVQHAYHLLDLINSLYKIRSCSLSLSKQAIESGKLRECLDFHIKKCLAPCIGRMSEEEYGEQIAGIRDLLRGNTGRLIKEFREKMQSAAAELDFEQAQLYKNSLEMLQQHYSKSLIVHPSITNVDVFTLVFEGYKVYGNFLQLNNGAIVKALNLEFRMNIEEQQSEMLSRFMVEVYRITGELKPQSKDDCEEGEISRMEDGCRRCKIGTGGGADCADRADRADRADGAGETETPDRLGSTREPAGIAVAGNSREVLVQFMPDQEFEGRSIHIPLRGDKLSLLELSLKNANAFKFQRLKQDAIKFADEEQVSADEVESGDGPNAGKNRSGGAAGSFAGSNKSGIGGGSVRISKSVEMLKRDLNMLQLPMHIECFDNSNIQGTNPVSACVVFKNGRPSKRDYRHFNIKTVVGANDFASMYEVVYRRYSRLLEEQGELPQLVLIDGGKGQLHFAHNALRDLNLHEKIKLISIAERLEELYIPGDPTPLFLDKSSPSLKLLMHLRDEAHRFGITHHREKRIKGQTASALMEVKGVGEATMQKLMLHYKSLKRLKESSFEELVSVVGKSLAKAIFDHFGIKR